jgi:hypothetical protein
VPSQPSLTDFLVDLIYPIDPIQGVEIVARVGGETVGVHRKRGRGTVTYLGFRPRDDQSASLGAEVRTWFEILKVLGAYPKSRTDVPVEDNPAVVSRESPVLATRFPNGTIALAAHYRSHVESWPGGFHRDGAQDRASLQRNPLPSDLIELRDRWVAGHQVTYRGRRIVALRVDDGGRLLAFGGYGAEGIQVDGREYRFAREPLDFLAFTPVPPARRVKDGAVMMIWVQAKGEFRVPAPSTLKRPRVYLQGGYQGSVGAEVAATLREGWLVFEAGRTGQSPQLADQAEHLLYVLAE